MDAEAALAQTQQQFTRVDRTKLIEQLKKNREHHKTAYEAALKGWAKQYADALKEYKAQLIEHGNECTALEVKLREAETPANIEEIENLTLLSRFSFPVRPESHVQEYTEIIARMSLSLDAHIYLSHRDFQQFVLDRWDWTEQFAATASNYLPPGVYTAAVPYTE